MMPGTSDEPGPEAGSEDHPPPEDGPEPNEPCLHGASEHGLDGPWLETHVRRACCALSIPPERVRVRVVGDPEMVALHARHLGRDDPTDVLTFVLSDPGAPLEVEIAVCAAEARRQAGDRGHRVEQELLLYTVHGLLHALGMDDHEPEAFAAMHAREDEVLIELGVGRTFDRPSQRQGSGGAR